jgi:hypothetical protein
MPLTLTPGIGDAITLAELADALDADPFDPRDEDALADRAGLLARLARNRTFLADLAVAELKQRCAGQVAGNAYGPQVFMLRPPNGRYVLRANFWPAAQDAAVQASGTAPFFYDLPHDHNFSFLTVGYLGPGYWSDYYEHHGDALAGLPDDPVALRFVERSQLREGRVLLYRAHRDIHVQQPPEQFSVSLNILAADPDQQWRTQYRFDVERGTIAAALTTAPIEVLTTLAVAMGHADGRDLAGHLARTHDVPRVRLTAYAALATLDPAAWEQAAADPARLVSASARVSLAAH